MRAMATSVDERRQAAARAAWDVAGERLHEAGRARLRGARRRLVAGLIVALAAGLGLARAGHPWASAVPGIVAVALAVALLTLSQARLVGLSDGARRFGDVVGRAVAYLVLTPVYLLVVWPLGALRRAQGHDPLQRRGAPRASYWRPHPRSGPTGRLF